MSSRDVEVVDNSDEDTDIDSGTVVENREELSEIFQNEVECGEGRRTIGRRIGRRRRRRRRKRI